MSDPVTHAEIEDVLSSIRRLVSEDPSSEEAAPHPAARLVLTPALRVQDSGAAPRPEPTEQASQNPVPDGAANNCDARPELEPDRSTEPEGPAAASAAADLAAELTAEPALVFHHRDMTPAKPPALEPSVQEQLAAAPTEPKAAAGQAEPAHDAAAEPVDSGGAAPDTDNPGAPNVPWVRPGATLFAAAADAAQRRASADAPGADTSAAEPGAQRACLDVVPPVDRQETPDATSVSETAKSGSAAHRAASVVRKIAELEARSQEQAQPDWEPDSVSEAPFASAGPDVIEWRDEPLRQTPFALAAHTTRGRVEPHEPKDTGAEAAADTSSPEAESAETAADDAGADPVKTLTETAATEAALDALAAGRDEAGSGDEGETFLDEDGLRDLVASIVREELQGALGERITRNVRKLVRREIHRALAAHDLL